MTIASVIPTTPTLSLAASAANGGNVALNMTLSSAATVRATILNMSGREVAVLTQQDLPQGTHVMLWSGRSTTGTKAPSGAYLVRVMAIDDAGHQVSSLTTLSLRR